MCGCQGQGCCRLGWASVRGKGWGLTSPSLGTGVCAHRTFLGTLLGCPHRLVKEAQMRLRDGSEFTPGAWSHTRSLLYKGPPPLPLPFATPGPSAPFRSGPTAVVRQSADLAPLWRASWHTGEEQSPASPSCQQVWLLPWYHPRSSPSPLPQPSAHCLPLKRNKI